MFMIPVFALRFQYCTHDWHKGFGLRLFQLCLLCFIQFSSVLSGLASSGAHMSWHIRVKLHPTKTANTTEYGHNGSVSDMSLGLESRNVSWSYFNIKMSELMSDDNDETLILSDTVIIFSHFCVTMEVLRENGIHAQNRTIRQSDEGENVPMKQWQRSQTKFM